MKYVLCVLLAVLAACAQLPKGLEMSPDDYVSCAEEGCHTFTEGELQKLINISILKWEEWKAKHSTRYEE